MLDEGAEITVGDLKKQGKKQRAGKKERIAMEGGGDAPRYVMLTMGLVFRAVTDQNMFQNLHVCRGEKKSIGDEQHGHDTIPDSVFHSHRATGNTFKKFTAIPPVKQHDMLCSSAPDT